MRGHRWAVVCVAAILAIAIAGCGGDDDEEEAGPAETGTTTEEAAKPKGGPVARVTISETEFKLDPDEPKVRKTGVVRFVAKNDGSVVHALEVEGPKGEKETENLEPGKSESFDIDLSKAGSYTMYCPVENHRQQGMEGKVEVAGVGSGAGGSSSKEEKEEDSGGASGY